MSSETRRLYKKPGAGQMKRSVVTRLPHPPLVSSALRSSSSETLLLPPLPLNKMAHFRYLWLRWMTSEPVIYSLFLATDLLYKESSVMEIEFLKMLLRVQDQSDQDVNRVGTQPPMTRS